MQIEIRRSTTTTAFRVQWSPLDLQCLTSVAPIVRWDPAIVHRGFS